MNPQELTSTKIASMNNNDLFEAAKSLDGLKEHVDLAFNLYHTAANRGHASAQNTLGSFYYYGIAGVEKNLDTAKYWYIRSAEQGFSLAYHNLGKFYFDNKEYLNAILWYTKCSKKGQGQGQVKSQSAINGKKGQGVNIQSQYMLGFIYYYGKGVDSNIEKAFELFTLASDNGHPHAQYLLGYMYYYAQGITVNREKAIELFTLSSNQGHDESQYMLGVIYYYGLHAVDLNIEKAVELLTVSATQGNGKAAFKLGEYYEFRKQNDIKALEFYRKGAEHGNPEAQCKLGYFYQYGKGGLDRNLPVSKEWYLKSASQGLPVGQYHAGMLFLYENNIKNAEKYLSRAAQQGYSKAFVEMGRIQMNKKHNKERASIFFMNALNSTHRENHICRESIQYLVAIAQHFELKKKDKALEIYIVLLQYHGLFSNLDSIVKNRFNLLYKKTR